MDLLSRLIAGSAATSPTKQKLNTPTERLSACKRICNALQQIWRNGTRLSEDTNASSHVASLLNRLNAILHDESRKAAPHSCLLNTASQQIYIIITKLALSSDSAEIVGAARQFFHLLINGEIDGVLDSKIFARALIDLVRRNTIFATIVVDEQGEADLVELLFEIATKIRLDPDILPGWFYPERDHNRNRPGSAEARRAQFPLFFLLVDYVHHDGPLGDFARTGLLYLTETASRSKPLENWMIESDLAPQMASGLSALYSRLSRRAPMLDENEKSLPIIAFSDAIAADSHHQDDNDDLEESQQSVKAFLSYLAFWQDTLNHCKSVEVKETLLDHFQVLFVQQLLYPSLLESSDVAGGSTAAVVLHLYRILDTVEHQQLLKRMLRYLLASSKQEAKPPEQKHSRARMSISRRQSMEKLATLAEMANTPSPDLFNLYDLLVMGLHSYNTQTVNASLKLVTMILRRHHPHVLSHLFGVESTEDERQQGLSEFNETLVRLFDLAGVIAQVDTADESYEAALNDSRILLERHSCVLATDEALNDDRAQHQVCVISPDCKLFAALLDLLRSFFANDPVTNVTLTETFVALASCERVVLRSWAVSSSETEKSLATTALMDIFAELADQVAAWRRQFSDWDSLFSFQRRLMSNVDEGVVPTTTRSISSQSRGSSMQGSPKLAPTGTSSTPVRSLTPRGRKIPPPAFGSIDGALASSPQISASPIKAIAGSPLHRTSFPGDSSDVSSVRSASSAPTAPALAILKQHVSLPIRIEQEMPISSMPQLAERLRLHDTGSGTSTPRTNEPLSGTVTPSVQGENAVRTTASVGHIITNAIILQEFIFEIAALLQVRATLFDEVDLSL